MEQVAACRESIVWEVVEKRGSDQPDGIQRGRRVMGIR